MEVHFDLFFRGKGDFIDPYLFKIIEYLNFSCKEFIHEKLIMYKISRSLYMIQV
ncbi:hypothetical protein LY11_00469 [Pedobacter cryoconitis]|uniref:Uncharacterized protein n=1 Tax=Pedobacter cryoconitis TaxID=188932 RepID=A0A327T8X2_9SPHI|nr:hypothetical protein LY11_00469 [Pedobacter cryoconitis]